MHMRNLCIATMLLLGTVAGGQAQDLPPCDPNDTTLLEPDMIGITPTNIRLVQRYNHRLLYFSSRYGNTGQGPLILHGHTVQGPDGGQVTQATQEIWRSDGSSCGHVAGFFVYHPTHRHFHFQDFAAYQLRKDDPYTGEVMVQAAKVSFCLIDLERLPGYNNNPQLVNDCLNAEGTEGISVGFADVYDSFLPGQFIDLDADPDHPVPGGSYYLVNVVNPKGLVWENDPNNNVGIASVNVPAPAPTHTRSTVNPPAAPPPPQVQTGGDNSPPAPPVQETVDPSTVRRQPHTPHTPRAPRPPLPINTAHRIGTSHGPHAPHGPTGGSTTAQRGSPHTPHAPRAPNQ